MTTAKPRQIFHYPANAGETAYTISTPMGAAIKPLDARYRRKGVSTGAARIARLKERLDTEQDPKVRAMIEAQLVAFDRHYRP